MTATVQSRYGKTEVIGMHWVGWLQFLHLIHFPSPYWRGGGWPNECQILPWNLYPGSHLGKVDLGYFVQEVMLRRMTHWDLPLLKAGSSSGCGTGWPPMWWMGSRSISHIWGLTCSALSLSAWQQCPCFALLFPHQGQWVVPLKWQSASGWCMPTNPITFGDSKGDITWKNLNPLGRVLSA